jgi:hypothetical protein
MVAIAPFYISAGAEKDELHILLSTVEAIEGSFDKPKIRRRAASRRVPRLPAFELPQHCALLDLVVLHALEDVIKSTHGLAQIRSLIKHHALGALAHCCVGDFGARRQSGFS